jgi:hypothetical protein
MGKVMRCPMCQGTGELPDATQPWAHPGAPAPRCGCCGGMGKVSIWKCLGYYLGRREVNE